jgi:glycosyltransferase involved in cell wall biosynthesis
MALSAGLLRTDQLQLRLLLREEELVPQWLGELLLDLDRIDGLVLQVQRVKGAATSVRQSMFSRFWLASSPGLRLWVPNQAARACIARWESAAGDAYDILLVLDAAMLPVSEVSAEGLLWAVVDGENCSLSPVAPLFDSICSGKGLHLKLLQRDAASTDWHTARRLHVAAPQNYGRAIQGLQQAVSRLVRQAVIDRRSGLGSVARPGTPICHFAPGKAPERLAIALARGYAGHLWKRLQAQLFTEYWRVGVIDAPISSFLQEDELQKVHWLTPDKVAGYWADPFPLPGDQHRLVCEYFDQYTGLGSLEVLHFDRDSQVMDRKHLTVGKGQHVSFPNVLEVDGRRLGVAETVAQRECMLHEVDEEGEWQPLFPLISDVAVADPALFLWEDRWWLAFTDCDRGELDNLCLYFADQLEGPWTPHANNPVKVDVTGARMAGAFFWHEGKLFRPAQDCLASYGAGLVMYRIVQLTPTCFEEVEVRRLSPDCHGEYRHGLHTINAWGARTLIDGKRHGINPLVLGRNLRKRWRRFLARMSTLFSGKARTGDDDASLSRVMVYIPHLRVGGGEISMWRLAEGLAATGFDVCIVAHSETTNELGIPAGVSFVSLDCGSTISALWRLSRILREREPHWLLSAFPHTNIAAVTALALSGQATRCIVTEHAPLSRQIVQQNNWRYRLLPSLVRWAYCRAHAVIAVSAGVRDDLQILLGPHVIPKVISNPVLSNSFEAEMALLADDPWLLDDGLRVVLSVCRLSVEKDLPTLVRAFAEVHGKRPETRLLLAGEGDDRERVQGLVQQMGLNDVIRLPGRTATPLAWMRHAAVFVLASRYEGFGNVLVEAMACGTPVVSTDCPVGPREILDHGRLGALVPVGDVPAMAQAIRQALDRPAPAEARKAALYHTQARACADYRQLFESLYRNGLPC